MAACTDWTLPGSKGALIHGTTHHSDTPHGVAVLVHGFKGYKDYGMFPHIAATLAREGLIVHRVSLSHSGMGHGHGDFDVDLFEQDTWNRSIEDVQALCSAIDTGKLAGDGMGTHLVGHSRGGAAVLAAAGRHAMDGSLGAMHSVTALSAPARLLGMSESHRAMLLRDGVLPTPSSRTGQTLRIGRAWLQEQLDDPAGHDLSALMAAITVPVTLIHGADDPTVPATDAVRLAQCAPDRVHVQLIDGADHVFNTPNPFDPAATASSQLAEVEATILERVSDTFS